jgi:hypothetical protein
MEAVIVTLKAIYGSGDLSVRRQRALRPPAVRIQDDSTATPLVG